MAVVWKEFVTILILYVLEFVASEPDLIVHTEHGPIKGINITFISSNKTFTAFLGIPYAKPPTGDRRFKAPDTADSWTELRNTTEEGAVCPQINPKNEDFIGEENCLFLNVFTPKLVSDADETLNPVMVWIHGGEFVSGSGNRDVNEPEFIVDEDVVLVTFNYRIGILGFLSLQNEEVPGNYGMKDQVMVLKWIKDNIAKFGGDPNKVTIFGEGSGASSVHYHMLSPMSRGLFHRAISQSGTPLNPWNTLGRDAGERMHFSLNQTFKDNETDAADNLLETLRKVEAHVLVNFVKKIIVKPIIGDLIGPTLDSHAREGEAFLPETPFKLTKEGKMANIPYMIGGNSKGGMEVVSAMEQLQWLLEPVVEVFEKALPYYIGVSIPEVHDMALEVKDKYFNNSKPLLQQYADVVMDHLYTTPLYCIAKSHANSTNSSIFAYLFNGTGQDNEFKYLFRTNSSIESSTMEEKNSRKVVKLWTNFAKTGNPTPEPTSELGNMTWSPVTESNFSYLLIGSELEMKNDSFNGNPTWWQKLYEKYAPDASPCWGLH